MDENFGWSYYSWLVGWKQWMQYGGNLGSQFGWLQDRVAKNMTTPKTMEVMTCYPIHTTIGNLFFCAIIGKTTTNHL